MEPRILLLMSSEEAYYATSAFYYSDSPFSFVPYKGTFSPEEVRKVLKTDNQNFDAVALAYHPTDEGYRELKEYVESTYEGPKILLFQFWGDKPAVHNEILGVDRELNPINGFDIVFGFTHLPDFYKRIQEYFGKL